MDSSSREYRTTEEEVKKHLRRTAALWQHKYTGTQNTNRTSFYFLLKAKEAAHRGTRQRRAETNAASWKWRGMMDDSRGPKHRINPPAQRDYPKVAAAVSPSPPARARRDAADGGEEDALVMEPGRAGVSASPGNGVERRWALEREMKERRVGSSARWRMNKGTDGECSQRRQTDGYFITAVNMPARADAAGSVPVPNDRNVSV